MTPSKPKSLHFPPAMLWAFAGLIASSLILVAWSRLTSAAAATDPVSAVVEVRSIVFEELPDGRIEARMYGDGRTLGEIAAGEDGFVRSTLRGLNRERKRFGVDRGGVLELIRRTDGSLTLSDPSTRIAIDLGAFGPSNVASFAAFMSPLSGAQDDASGTPLGAMTFVGKPRSSG